MADTIESSGAIICSPQSTSSTKEEICRSLPEEAFNHFLQGKRHMLVQDYKFAVASLTEACDQYVNHYGELALECGEVYFLYGKALFRYSQEQSGVLGDVLNEGSNKDENSSDEGKENDSDKSDSDEEEEEDGTVKDEDKEDEEEEPEEKEPSESTDSPQGLNEVSEGVSSSQVNEDGSVPKPELQNSVDNATSSTVDAVPGTSKSPEENDQLEDDLELAWNALETAKTIFSRQGADNKEAQLKVAETLQLLAEISMESDNYMAALQDLQDCLKIQNKYLSSDDRRLAETYYQMGLAHVLDKQYCEGVENFKATKDIIELKIKHLKLLPAPESSVPFDEDPKFEISNLEGLLPDIKEKIEDTEELIRNAMKELENVFEKMGEVSSSSGGPSFSSASTSASASTSSTSSKPISNITHLLKRKKPEQDNEHDLESRKKAKLSPCASNGDLNMLPDTTSESNI